MNISGLPVAFIATKQTGQTPHTFGAYPVLLLRRSLNVFLSPRELNRHFRYHKSQFNFLSRYNQFLSLAGHFCSLANAINYELSSTTKATTVLNLSVQDQEHRAH